MVDFQLKKSYTINDLISIMKILRSENGCPWDKEQDHHSIRKNFLEETYEVLEAIDNDDPVLLREELGDVLLQVVFHSQMEAEKDVFDFDDVADELCKKLIIRHPHVFGDLNVDNSSEVLKNWDKIKKETKNQGTYTETLENVPNILPALMRSYKIGQRAKRAGMDFQDADEALKCMEGEISELKLSIKNGKSEEISDELGDVLFSVVNVARKLEIDPEECLSQACEKFIRRFAKVEQMIRLNGNEIDMNSLSINELDAYWQKAKES